MKFAKLGEAGDYTEPMRELDPLIFKLRKLRYSKGISQRLLAKKMGYDVETLKRAESGRQRPSYPVLKTWVEALGARLDIVVD